MERRNAGRIALYPIQKGQRQPELPYVCRYLDFNADAEFQFVVINFTNSLKRLFIEFKYSDNNCILETFEFSIDSGKNHLKIPLGPMRSKALSNISEICFVIHPDDVTEEEGMFKIGGIEIR